MRKLFVITSLLFSLSLNAQSYHPFPDTTSIWHAVGINFFNHSDYIFNLGIKGDTILNNKKYSKIYRTPNSSFSYNLTYIGALRENENKQVLLTLPEDTSEFVLYDFNLNVGDTIFYPIGYGLCGNNWINAPIKSSRVVTSIDSILLYNNEYRKRWILSCDWCPGDVWVEGIGSIKFFGLLNPLISDVTLCGDIYAFGCFLESNEILYFDSTVCNYCMGNYILNIPAYHDDQQQFNVSYNPSGKILSINSNKEPVNFSITIFNAIGQTVYNNSITSQTYSLSLSTLIKGIYFYRISNHSDNLSTGKFMTY